MTARGAFAGVIVGKLVILASWKFTSIAFLWYNVIGCGVVILSAVVLSAVLPDPAPARRT